MPASASVDSRRRVRDDAQRLILPEEFLAVAEESGLMGAIDEVVRADAISHAHLWGTRCGSADIAVAINVSARHLADVGFQRGLIASLAQAELEPGQLQIEVTERILMEASNSAMSGLVALRQAGVQVGLDDFGTGYSSLAYLQQFPLDFLKIDRSFVATLDTNTVSFAIVSAILSVAQGLRLTVVAEGVETPRQLEILQSLACDRAQGFLFSASLSPTAFESYAAASRPAT